MTWIPASAVGRLRAGIIVFALIVTAAKLWIAAHTYGSYDVLIWTAFSDSVRENGPIGIYGSDPVMIFNGQERFPLYNHPPLSGWMLLVLNWIADQFSVAFSTLIRFPATLADIGSAVLLFELIRKIRPNWQAATAAILMLLSPVLITVSGFHGNTDPVFVMFSLLSVYLVVQRHPLLAGLAIGVALSIKLIPLVLLPLLLAALIRMGWRQVLRFGIGGAAVFAVLWIPVLLVQPKHFIGNVLGYRGVSEHLYGVPQFATWLDLPGRLINFYAGPGSTLVLIICATIPAYMVWRRPDSIITATGVALSSFLLLTPAFGVQYLSWAVAAAFLIGVWAGALYSFVAGLFAVQLYSTWSGAFPGNWWYAIPVYWTPREFALMTLTWLALALVTYLGLRTEFGAPLRQTYQRLTQKRRELPAPSEERVPA